jgi:ABC-type Zn uptake system ZnuABC Zn-binding protein ZnuA/ABC-type Mn2+/Zn2+ transport system permease subunit
MLEPFTLPYVQEGLAEILLLSIPAGLIGTWIVLRGLSFYSHAVGTASFPGLVLADGLGFSPALGAFGMAGLFTAFSALAARSRRTATDSATALVLVSCLAVGVILASDVFGSGANIDTLLFGSLLAIGSNDLILAGAAAALAIVVTGLCSHHWLAKGFDQDSAAALHSKSAWFDVALLASVAVTVTAALSAVGALLVAAIMVVPAATVRMLTSRVRTLQIGSVLLVAAEGTAGLWLSVQTDAPPGATIAVLSGAVFAIVLALRAVRRRRLAGIAAAALGVALIASGCGGSGNGGATGDQLTAVATTTQVADIVREVGGDAVQVEQILQPNTDPHDYEPRPSDVQAVADADLVFRSGGDLDSWVGQLVDDSGSDAEITDLSSSLPVLLENGHNHGEGSHSHDKEDDDHSESAENSDTGDHSHDGELDPHWWQDPRNVAAAAGEVKAALAQADPTASPEFRSNATAFRGRVDRLDRQIARCFESLPADQRKLVTDHDALAYFADRYGIEVVGTVIPALTTEAQPSAGDLAELERTIEREGVRAIFPESSYSPKLAEAVAADTGATTEYSLYGDALGPEGSGAETWTGMIKANADAMMRGFTGGARGCDFG